MARILCSISGLDFTVQHFPLTLQSREYHHPIFCLNTRKLVAYSGKWASGQLTTTDSYLLFLALLNSTDLVDWRVPVQRTAITDSLVANNMEALIRTTVRIDSIKNPHVTLPQFACTPDTKTLANVKYWIEAWQVAISEYEEGYRSVSEDYKLAKKEQALEILIKNPLRKPETLAASIAAWAELAGNFPTSTTLVGTTQIPLSEYWKSIIRKCATEDSVFSIIEDDLKELIEYCEINIPHGTIQAQALMEMLRDTLERIHNFLDLGDPDISSDSGFRILSPETSIADANLQALLDTAPTKEPRREHYPTYGMFIKAKMRWTLAKQRGI